MRHLGQVGLYDLQQTVCNEGSVWIITLYYKSRVTAKQGSNSHLTKHL